MTGITIIEDNFGNVQQPHSKNLECIKRFTFMNSNDVSIQVITYGATITSIKVPDRNGQIDDIALGFDDIDGYTSSANPYFGATIGRVCNRINNATFTLNGKLYELTKNKGKNQLHGGFYGFDKFNWKSFVTGTKVIMTLINNDTYEGYPGTVLTTVSFELKPDNQFCIDFSAVTTESTPINLTNHTYFNLAGHNTGSTEIYKHHVTLNADKYTVTDSESIPTGEIKDVTETAFDLRAGKILGPALVSLKEAGFDDNFCVTTSKKQLKIISTTLHEGSGRVLEVYSDQPGVQFYTSNYLPDPENNIYPKGKETLMTALNTSEPINGKMGAEYKKHGGFCLETQVYPDAVNHKNFPSTFINPGETYTHQLIYKFGIMSQ